MRLIALAMVMYGWLAGLAWADVTYPERPAKWNYVVDEAWMIPQIDRDWINTCAGNVEIQNDIPIVVVTIKSLATYGAQGMSMESYARELFNHWGIGRADHNYGILLLISPHDRAARIELGAGWAHDHDAVCQTIMDTLIVPNFKAENPVTAIRAGVQGLANMARGEAIPKQPLEQRVTAAAQSAWSGILIVSAALVSAPVVAIVAFALLVGRSRGFLFGSRSPESWGYSNSSGGIWGGGESSGADGGSGGGFGGGDSGGGSSGGGGASGSW